MRKTIATVAAVAVGVLGLSSVPAQAAVARIECRTVVKLNITGSLATIHVVTNHPDPHKVYSYVARFSGDNGRPLVFDRRGSYGPDFGIGGHYWSQITAWQDGTRCKTWLNQGDV